MSNLRLQNGIYHARLTVPKDVREHFQKHEFSQSLQTGNRKQAEIRSGLVIAGWWQQIDAARGNQTPETWAMLAAKDYSQASNEETYDEDGDAIPSERTHLEWAFHEHLEDQMATGCVIEIDAVRAYKLAIGQSTLLKHHEKDYLNQYRNHSIKTQASYAAALNRFTDAFTDSASVTPEAIEVWIDGMALKENLAAKTITRVACQAKSFWSYLYKRKIVSVNHFKEVEVSAPKAATKKQSYTPFSPDEVIALHKAALAQQDVQLALLIRLGMYTGARLEELAMLKTSDVNLKNQAFSIRGTKTAAADRVIPIHSDLLPELTLIVDSGREYLIEGLVIDVRGERGKAIGKRFGRLKHAMGFEDRTRVFHSIRKTVSTMFEQAGVPEGVAADIIGHEKKTMTYGLYSGGSSMDQKRDAIRKIMYQTIS